MSEKLKGKSVAIVCDWLTNMGGAEKVIHSLHRMFPKAPIYTTLYDPSRVQGFENAEIYTSFLQRIPYSQKKHPLFLSLMPMAVESFNLDQYDVVISSSHAVAKGVITKPETLHISYCHTPMRYAWEPWELEYRLQGFPSVMHSSIKRRIHKLRIWDRLSADRVDQFIANSSYISQRIGKYYRRESEVIHPPVQVEQFSLGNSEGFYLMVGRLISYKRFDLVIETFAKNGFPLKIAGTGPDETRLKELATKNVEFLGRVSDEELKGLYQSCEALIFPQLEDFGITPVECMASGRPVIAYGRGGALDTVLDGKTGLLFPEQSTESLQSALDAFQKKKWDGATIQEHAKNFSDEQFQQKLSDLIESSL